MFIKSTCCTNIFLFNEILFSTNIVQFYLLQQSSSVISIAPMITNFNCSNVQAFLALVFTKSICYTDVHQCSSISCTDVHKIHQYTDFHECSSIGFTDVYQCSSISSTDVHRLVVGARLRIHTGELDPPKCHSAHFSSFLLCKGFSTIWTMSTTSKTSAIS